MSSHTCSVATGRRIAAVAGLVLSAAYTFYAWRELDFGRWHRPGAAIFPIAVGIILAVASIAILLERRNTSNEVHGATFTLPAGADLRRLVFVLGAFAIYFVAMEYIGHLIASALFLFVAMAILSDKSKLRLALYAVVIAGSFELFFVRFLQVQMPYGLTRLF
ncbi:tripartite tricarboxylate transporter TctB family protein [Bradyrhizobium sp. LHD-71]|uniref:tripartite tricarboxylate transporter TctB family protein n=1 Tax=Bradyrhizobium sp. LHD-71 TaxID=3072141 RepID=UPI00280D8304|nr:tripartite tricarboxylate transporter TctB family protein [Bradyrhizobium sp. LHD-71]MDQ8731385.1 tripartite tricarboxylate transporter TctB family protein [Bradyrhizobium sp. LHD-71]